jgi:hypothetical protein
MIRISTEDGLTRPKSAGNYIQNINECNYGVFDAVLLSFSLQDLRMHLGQQ